MRTFVVVPSFLFFLAPSLFPQSRQAVGIILAKTGDVQVSAPSPRVAEPLSLLFTGDSVRFSDSAGIKVLWSNGTAQWFSVSWKIPPTQELAIGIGSVVSHAHAIDEWLNTKINEKPDNLRNGKDPEVFLKWPRNTYVLETPDKLRWDGPSRRRYSVIVRCYENGYSFTEGVADLTCRVEEDAIEAGKPYYWFVNYAGQTVSEIPAAAWFAKLSKERSDELDVQTSQLRAIMSPDTNSATFRLLYANLLTNYELYADALTVLTSINGQTNKNGLILGLQAFLYDKMDMKKESDAVIRMTDAVHGDRKD